MAPPKRKTGGRVTPKGTTPHGPPRADIAASDQLRDGPASSTRYTPPKSAVYAKPPSRVIPFIMFGAWILGGLMIIANYIGILPGDQNNWYLVGGLGLILVGLFAATKFR